MTRRLAVLLSLSLLLAGGAAGQETPGDAVSLAPGEAQDHAREGQAGTGETPREEMAGGAPVAAAPEHAVAPPGGKEGAWERMESGFGAAALFAAAQGAGVVVMFGLGVLLPYALSGVLPLLIFGAGVVGYSVAPRGDGGYLAADFLVWGAVAAVAAWVGGIVMMVTGWAASAMGLGVWAVAGAFVGSCAAWSASHAGASRRPPARFMVMAFLPPMAVALGGMVGQLFTAGVAIAAAVAAGTVAAWVWPGGGNPAARMNLGPMGRVPMGELQQGLLFNLWLPFGLAAATIPFFTLPAVAALSLVCPAVAAGLTDADAEAVGPH